MALANKRSAEFKAYLDHLNQGLSEDEWKVTCIRFAPNDPTQNPVEDIWLYAKNFIREFYQGVQIISSGQEII